MNTVIALCPLLLHLFAWRWLNELSPSFAVVVSVLALLASGYLLIQRRIGPLASYADLGIALLVTVNLVRFPWLWDCEVSCAGAGYYRYLFDIQVVSWASLLYLALLLSLPLARVHGLWRAVAHGLAALAIGGSLYFLVLSARIELWCPHCLCVHGMALLLFVPLLRSAPKIQLWLAPLLAASFFLVHFCFHPQVHGGANPVVPPTASPTGANSSDTANPWNPEAIKIRRLADSGRRIGAVDASWTLDVVLSFECPHCATMMTDLMPELLAIAEEADCQIRFMHEHMAMGIPHISTDRARRALATAVWSPTVYRAYLLHMLGSQDRPRLSQDDEHIAQHRLFTSASIASLTRFVDEHRETFDSILRYDQYFVDRLDVPTTPALLLHTRSSDTIEQRWLSEGIDDELRGGTLRSTILGICGPAQ